MWTRLFCIVSVFASFSSGASCLSEYLPGSFRKIVTYGDYLLGIDQFGVVRQVGDIGVIGKYLDTPVCRVRNVISVAGGVENIAVLINTDSGKQEIRAWGRNALKVFSGDMNDWRPIEPPVPSSMISRRGYEGMLLAKDGDVYSWMYYADIKKIQGLPKMSQVVSGILFNVGIDRSGRVWEWAGFLGNDDMYPRKELINTGPRPVMVDVRAIEVSVGLSHYLVLGDNGAVYARIYGETPESDLIVRVEGLSGIKKIASGNNVGFALDQAGAAKMFFLDRPELGKRIQSIEIVQSSFNGSDIAATKGLFNKSSEEQAAYILTGEGCIYRIDIPRKNEGTRIRKIPAVC